MPQSEAVVFGDERFNYRQFDAEVNRYARAMLAAGVRHGARVAMLCTPRPEFLFTLLAAMRIGAPWVGLNPKYRYDELRTIIASCKPALLIALRRHPDGRDYADELIALQDDLNGDTRVVTIGAGPRATIPTLESFLSAAATGPGLAPLATMPGRRDAAVVVYTSGTTGQPKGAMLSHDSFFHSHKALSESFPVDPDLRNGHRVICNLPANHVGCLADICGNALIDGGTIVFMDRFDPMGVVECIDRERITMLGALPLMHQAIFDAADHAGRELRSLRAVLWGGAPMPIGLLQRVAQRGRFLSSHYGLTEGGSINSISRPGSDLDTLAGTIGWPDSDHEYRVVDAAGADVAVGEVGEIRIRGAGVMLGYLNDPEATKAAISEDGWLRTGDLAEPLVNGAWRFAGRITEMYKSGGYNIYPREIELVLESHPGVLSAAVVPVASERYGEVGCAFIGSAPGISVTEDALQAFLASRLANYKRPKSYVFRTDLPVLASGKLDRLALRREAERMTASPPR